jgi:transposase-like protein
MVCKKHKATEPCPIPELKELLSGRKITVDGDAVVCPHCFSYENKFRGARGVRKCVGCTKTFFVLKRGPYSYLTSKTEIDNGEVPE